MSDPMAIADVSRRSLKHKADQEQRSSLGQFFTPPAIARLMASMSSLSRDSLRFLDPGAGAVHSPPRGSQRSARALNAPKSWNLSPWRSMRASIPSLNRR